MFRRAPRLIALPGAPRALPRPPVPARRCLSTAPPAQKARSWKSLVARLGLAGAVVYFYNSTDVLDEPRYLRPVAEKEMEDLPTIESIAAQRRERRAVQLQLERQREREEEAAAERLLAGQEGGVEGQEGGIEGQEGGIEGLEAEADQQGAFNPETGEINWDCPCLGGMATGPCGDEFKAAFSCFVFSKEEPKGMDCIDKFKNMQNCFRQYPEVYGSEIDTDDDDDDDMTADAAADVSTPTDSIPAPTLSGEQNTPPVTEPKPKPKPTAPSGPHSPAQLAENRRELGLVPSSYRPSEDEASSDDGEKTQ